MPKGEPLGNRSDSNYKCFRRYKETEKWNNCQKIT